jgi:hypothetical protein
MSILDIEFQDRLKSQDRLKGYYQEIVSREALNKSGGNINQLRGSGLHSHPPYYYQGGAFCSSSYPVTEMSYYSGGAEDYYCGSKVDPLRRRYGTMSECARVNKVNLYGLRRIDPITLAKANKEREKPKDSVSKAKIDLNGLRGKIKKLEQEVRYEKGSKKKKAQKELDKTKEKTRGVIKILKDAGIEIKAKKKPSIDMEKRIKEISEQQKKAKAKQKKTKQKHQDIDELKENEDRYYYMMERQKEEKEVEKRRKIREAKENEELKKKLKMIDDKKHAAEKKIREMNKIVESANAKAAERKAAEKKIEKQKEIIDKIMDQSAKAKDKLKKIKKKVQDIEAQNR